MPDDTMHRRNHPDAGPGLFGRMRGRVFHWWFLASRPMTLGVRGLVLDRPANAVLLVRHTYVPGWQLPGGGVEPGETMPYALQRELAEEANITLEGEATLVSLHFNRNASRRDHVALFVVERFRQDAPRRGDREIAEARFFALDSLPEATTPATRRRLAEVLGGTKASPYW